MEKIKKHKNKLIAAVIILVIAGAFVWGRFGYSNSQSRLPYSFIKVQKIDFVREVKLTGTVKPAEEIKLSFENSGKVAKTTVKAGDIVKAGQVLAELDKTDASAGYLSALAAWQAAKSQVAQTQAGLDLQKISKQNILKGAKTEDVSLSETQVEGAQKSFNDASANLANVRSKAEADLDNLYAKTDDAFNDAANKTHDSLYLLTGLMFSDADAANPKLIFDTPLDTSRRQSAEAGRVKAVVALNDLNKAVRSETADHANYQEIFSRVNSDLAVIKNYLDTLNTALNDSSVSNSFTLTTQTSYKTNVSTAISAVNAASASLDSLKQSIAMQIKVNENAIFTAQSQMDSAQSALKLAQSQLTLKKSSATTEQIAIQDAQIRQAQAGLAVQNAQLTAAAANLEKAKSQLAKTAIIAPITGVITKIDLDPGEAISANMPVINLQSAGKFQVETSLPELYIGEVNQGDRAIVSFDAYGNDRQFEAKVISIDPAVENQTGVPTYRTLLEFINEEAEIKTGLTANANIIINEAKDVLAIPESSVIKDGEKNFVIVDNGTHSGEKREVTVSKSGRNSFVQVLSGLKEGDLVADFGSLIK